MSKVSMSNVEMRIFRICYCELVRLLAKGNQGNEMVLLEGQDMASGT